MSNLLDDLRKAAPEGPFGVYTGDRSAGIQHWPGYNSLEPEDKLVFERVQKGDQEEAVITMADKYLLVQHDTSGSPSPYTQDRVWGYIVRQMPSARSDAGAPSSKDLSTRSVVIGCIAGLLIGSLAVLRLGNGAAATGVNEVALQHELDELKASNVAIRREFDELKASLKAHDSRGFHKDSPEMQASVQRAFTEPLPDGTTLIGRITAQVVAALRASGAKSLDKKPASTSKK